MTARTSGGGGGLTLAGANMPFTLSAQTDGVLAVRLRYAASDLSRLHLDLVSSTFRISQANNVVREVCDHARCVFVFESGTPRLH
jgi:hypothetical protein